MNSPPLTVIVPTHGRPTLLERTLESISQCGLPKSYEEMVIVENGTRDGAEELVETLPEHLNARYMHRERANKSYALNQALETIAEGLVVFFDDDVYVHPDTLVAYAETAKQYGPGHFFGGPVEVEREEEPHESLEPWFPPSVRGYDLKESRMGDKYIGFNWAAYTADLAEVGGFNTNLGPGEDTPTDAGDESELQKRMLEKGFTGVDVHRAKVSHFVPAEKVTLRWLLKWEIQMGIFIGYESNLSWVRFWWESIIWRTTKSVAAAGKALILVEEEKLVREVTSTFKRVGKVKGYLWKHWND